VHEAAERYFHLLASLEHPSTTRCSVASVCARCGGGPMTVEPGKTRKRGGRTPDREVCSTCRRGWVARDLRDQLLGEGGSTRCIRCGGARDRNRCASCKETWVPESRWRKRTVKRPHVRPSGVDRSDDRAELMALRPIFEPRPPAMSRSDWTMHRLCLGAQAAKRLSVAEIAKEGSRIQPHAPRGWTEDTVRGALERMTSICEGRLRTNGFWGGARRPGSDDQGGRRWRRPRSYSTSNASHAAAV